MIPGGNLGNVSALGAGFQMMLNLGLIAKRPRLVLAQAAAANPLYRAYKNNWQFEPVRAGDARNRHSDWQPGLHPPRHSRVATVRGHRRAGDRGRAADAAARADRTGMFNCPHTAVALAALEKLIPRGEVERRIG